MKAAQIRTNTATVVQQMQACTGAIYNAPQNGPIRARVPLNSAQPTLEQLSSTDHISDTEKPLVVAAYDALVECRKVTLNQLSQATPTFVSILASAYAKNDDVLIELLQKKITWGDEVKQVRDLSVATNAQLVAEGQRIDAGLARENQGELAARQRAFAAFAQYQQNQQIINAMNRPVITNCTGFGNSVNCISH